MSNAKDSKSPLLFIQAKVEKCLRSVIPSRSTDMKHRRLKHPGLAGSQREHRTGPYFT